MDNINQYLKLDHGVTKSVPVVLKHDTWGKTGRGQFDMHYEVELGIVVSGKMIRKHGTWEHLFTKGDIWFNSVWEPHGTEIIEVPIELLMFHIFPPALAQMNFPENNYINWLSFFTCPIERRLTRLTKKLDFPLQIANLAIELIKKEQQNPLYNLKVRQLMMELLIAVAEEKPLEMKQYRASYSEYAKINQAIKLVFASQEMVTFNQAVEESGLNRTHFAKYFKEFMGMSFAKFALRYRLGCAAKELQTSNFSIKEIASKWGFTDSSHFHRNFIKNYGITPTEYRDRKTQNKKEDQ